MLVFLHPYDTTRILAHGAGVITTLYMYMYRFLGLGKLDYTSINAHAQLHGVWHRLRRLDRANVCKLGFRLTAIGLRDRNEFLYQFPA